MNMNLTTIETLRHLLRNRSEIVHSLIRGMRTTGATDDPDREADLYNYELLLRLFLATDAENILNVLDPIQEAP